MKDKKYVGFKEAMKILDLSESMIRVLVKNGKLSKKNLPKKTSKAINFKCFSDEKRAFAQSVVKYYRELRKNNFEGCAATLTLDYYSRKDNNPQGFKLSLSTIREWNRAISGDKSPLFLISMESIKKYKENKRGKGCRIWLRMTKQEFDELGLTFDEVVQALREFAAKKAESSSKKT
jgi:hypothetical protein